LTLWIEAAQGLLRTACAPDTEQPSRDLTGTFQTEERFVALLASSPPDGAPGTARAAVVADRMVQALRQGVGMDVVAQGLLASLPPGQHLPIAILHVLGGSQASLLEIDAPPLFLTRRAELVLLPVLEEPEQGRLVRRCEFALESGDYLAMVSEGFIRARGLSRRWGWRDIATSTRRLTDTGCDAQQLLAALLRLAERMAQGACPATLRAPDRKRSVARSEAEPGEGQPERDVTVLAMHVRPQRTATVWSGPPADRTQDETALRRLMAEEGTRIICGDTTAQIAARLLGVELQLARRPNGGWGDVPPLALLEGIDLVTEGLVTLGLARRRLSAAKDIGDLPKGDDAASRLARALLLADRVRFIVGLAVNPPQAADAEGLVPRRRTVIEELIEELRARGKVVPAEYL
jgi:hypothetical protein